MGRQGIDLLETCGPVWSIGILIYEQRELTGKGYVSRNNISIFLPRSLVERWEVTGTVTTRSARRHFTCTDSSWVSRQGEIKSD